MEKTEAVVNEIEDDEVRSDVLFELAVSYSSL